MKSNFIYLSEALERYIKGFNTRNRKTDNTLAWLKDNKRHRFIIWPESERKSIHNADKIFFIVKTYDALSFIDIENNTPRIYIFLP